MRRSQNYIASIIMASCFLHMNASAEKISDNVSLHGDLRYRNELIDQDGKDQRNRQRIRARFGIKADVGSDVFLNITLASGSTDPISTNQTLGDGFTTKQINLDIASFQWKPQSAKGVSITGGKMKNPFYKPGKSELLWDGDLRPEGMAASFKRKVATTEFFITAAGFWITESSGRSDVGLRALQGGFKVSAPNGTSSLTAGGGYFDYSNLKGGSFLVDGSDSFGNSYIYICPSCFFFSNTYRYDFKIIEAFSEIVVQTKSVSLAGFFDFAQNTDPESDNIAWLVGASVSKITKKPGSWRARYSYRKLERDAVLGAFTDSDFGGGGTNVQGHELGLKVILSKNTNASTTVFINDRGLNSERDYKRYQLDLNFKI